MNNFFQAINYAFTDSLSSIFISLTHFLPNLLGALFTFIVGLILGGWTKTIITKILRSLNFNKLFASELIRKFLEQAQVKDNLEAIVGEIVRYSIIIIFFVSSINILGLTTLTQVLTGILAYIPRVIGAVIVLLVGVLLAGLVEKIIKGSLSSYDVKIGRAFGKFASYTVFVFAFLATFSQLGIAENFINTIFTGFIAMLALGLGLSLGLGSKDLVRSLLEEWYKNIKKDLG